VIVPRANGFRSLTSKFTFRLSSQGKDLHGVKRLWGLAVGLCSSTGPTCTRNAGALSARVCLRGDVRFPVDFVFVAGRALLANGKPEQGHKVFESLLDRHPREPKIYDALATLNKRQFNYEGALEVLRRQRRKFPQDEELALRVGRLHEQMGEYEAARSVYDSTQALAGSEDFSPTVAYAQTFVEQDSLGAAGAAYRRILEQRPDHVKALRGLGRVREQQAAWTEALDVYKRLRDVEGETAYAHVKLGQVHEKLGRVDRAFQAYRTSIDQGADHPLPYYRYAVLLHRRADSVGAFEAAERALRKSLRAVEELQENQLLQLQRSVRSGFPDENRQRGQKRLEAYDRIAEEAFRFFAGAFPAQRTEPVITDLLREYKNAGRLHYLAGIFYEKQGVPAKALKQYKHAVRETPRLRTAHVALGGLYEERGAFRKALRSYERARSLDDEAPEVYRALLRLHQRHGTLGALIQRWRARYRSAPQNDVLREHLIEALHKAGRYEEARALAGAASTSG